MREIVQKYSGIYPFIPAIGIVVLTYVYYKINRRNYPPGPKGLPLLGYVTNLGTNPAETFMKLAKEYGRVFSVQLGRQHWVVLNDMDSISEALVQKGNDFSGRPKLHVMQKMSEGLGVIFRDHGPEWKLQKKFAVSTLKKFGAKENDLEDFILAEMNHVFVDIQSKNGKAFSCQKLLSKAASNIICRIVFGTRFEYDDVKFKDLISRLDITFVKESTAPLILAMTVAPITRFLPGFRETYRGFSEDLNKIFGHLTEILADHKKAFDESDIRDFIDEFLNKMKSETEIAGSSFKDRQIFQFMRELFTAGSVNISSAELWCVLGLAHYPEYQEKIAEEIKTIIEVTGDIPHMKHKTDMPFTRAFIQEVMRYRTLVPFGMPHCTTNDTSVDGYTVPKDTPVLVNLWSVHHDSDTFKDPDQFKPERFINSEGNYEPVKNLIPFSIGPRVCLATQLSKIEIFMFLTVLVRKYKILPPPGKPLPAFSDGVFGLLYVPNDFEVVFEPRE